MAEGVDEKDPQWNDDYSGRSEASLVMVAEK